MDKTQRDIIEQRSALYDYRLSSGKPDRNNPYSLLEDCGYLHVFTVESLFGLDFQSALSEIEESKEKAKLTEDIFALVASPGFDKAEAVLQFLRSRVDDAVYDYQLARRVGPDFPLVQDQEVQALAACRFIRRHAGKH